MDLLHLYLVRIRPDMLTYCLYDRDFIIDKVNKYTFLRILDQVQDQTQPEDKSDDNDDEDQEEKEKQLKVWQFY